MNPQAESNFNHSLYIFKQKKISEITNFIDKFVQLKELDCNIFSLLHSQFSEPANLPPITFFQGNNLFNVKQNQCVAEKAEALQLTNKGNSDEYILTPRIDINHSLMNENTQLKVPSIYGGGYTELTASEYNAISQNKELYTAYNNGLDNIKNWTELISHLLNCILKKLNEITNSEILLALFYIIGSVEHFPNDDICFYLGNDLMYNIYDIIYCQFPSRVPDVKAIFYELITSKFNYAICLLLKITLTFTKNISDEQDFYSFTTKQQDILIFNATNGYTESVIQLPSFLFLTLCYCHVSISHYEPWLRIYFNYFQTYIISFFNNYYYDKYTNHLDKIILNMSSHNKKFSELIPGEQHVIAKIFEVKYLKSYFPLFSHSFLLIIFLYILFQRYIYRSEIYIESNFPLMYELQKQKRQIDTAPNSSCPSCKYSNLMFIDYANYYSLAYFQYFFDTYQLKKDHQRNCFKLYQSMTTKFKNDIIFRTNVDSEINCSLFKHILLIFELILMFQPIESIFDTFSIIFTNNNNPLSSVSKFSRTSHYLCELLSCYPLIYYYLSVSKLGIFCISTKDILTNKFDIETDKLILNFNFNPIVIDENEELCNFFLSGIFVFIGSNSKVNRKLEFI